MTTNVLRRDRYRFTRNGRQQTEGGPSFSIARQMTWSLIRHECAMVHSSIGYACAITLTIARSPQRSSAVRNKRWMDANDKWVKVGVCCKDAELAAPWEQAGLARQASSRLQRHHHNRSVLEYLGSVQGSVIFRCPVLFSLLIFPFCYVLIHTLTMPMISPFS